MKHNLQTAGQGSGRLFVIIWQVDSQYHKSFIVERLRLLCLLANRVKVAIFHFFIVPLLLTMTTINFVVVYAVHLFHQQYNNVLRILLFALHCSHNRQFHCSWRIRHALGIGLLHDTSGEEGHRLENRVRLPLWQPRRYAGDLGVGATGEYKLFNLFYYHY